MNALLVKRCFSAISSPIVFAEYSCYCLFGAKIFLLTSSDHHTTNLCCSIGCRG